MSHPEGEPSPAAHRWRALPDLGPPRRYDSERQPPVRDPLEGIISADRAQSWAYAEDFVTEDEVLLRARGRAAQLGCHSMLPGSAAALTVLAAALGARSAVEVGTGTGVASLALLRGMLPDGVLTTIDVEVEHQRAAKLAFAEAGFRPTRARAISGRALDVLPRLTDAAYDLVVVSAAETSCAVYVDQAQRLLREGGMLVVDNALWGGNVADPARRDDVTTAVREVGRRVRDDEHLLSMLLPVGDGLLVSVKRSQKV